jgi:hypothetical protein
MLRAEVYARAMCASQYVKRASWVLLNYSIGSMCSVPGFSNVSSGVFITYFPHIQYKRTTGRAPVWGSEFTTQVDTLQGDSAEIAPTLNVKFCDSVVVAVVMRGVLPRF